MRFKSSKFEVRYNSFWNDEVVSSYKLLINHPEFKGKLFFSENYPSIDSLLKKYCNGVINIVNNIQRQMDDFDDNRNTARYLVDVKLQAIDDLNEFKANIESRFKESSHLFLISKVIDKLESGDSYLSLTEIIKETHHKAIDDSKINSDSDVSTCEVPINLGFDELNQSYFLPHQAATMNSADNMDIDNLEELDLEDPSWNFN